MHEQTNKFPWQELKSLLVDGGKIVLIFSYPVAALAAVQPGGLGIAARIYIALVIVAGLVGIYREGLQ